MTRHKKSKEYDTYRPTDDLQQRKQSRQIKLPKIQHGPTIANGVPKLWKTDKLHQQLTDECQRKSKLPVIKEAEYSDRPMFYCDGPLFSDNETEAKMMLVAGKMLKKYTNVYDKHPIEMATTFAHDAYSAWHNPEENGWDDSFGEYGSFYRRETAPLSSTEREQELDKKRQAMLELRDKQVRFFRKCKQEHLEAHHLSDKTKSYTEKQHHEPMPPTCQEPQKKNKRKKATKDERGKRAKENAEDVQKNTKFNQSHRNDLPFEYNKESNVPSLHEGSDIPLKYEPKSNTLFLSPDDKKGTTQEDMIPELFIQADYTKSKRIQDHPPLPPLRQNSSITQPLSQLCPKPNVIQTLSPIFENQHCSNSHLPSIRKIQESEYQSVSSISPAVEHIPISLPLNESQQDLYLVISTPSNPTEINTGKSFDSDSIFEPGSGNALGILAHVVTDEELRKELRLDLSFAHTPAPKKEQTKPSPKRRQKKSAKQSENEEKLRQKTKKHEDRL